MSGQFGLPFEWPADPRDDEFLVTEASARAAHQLEHWGAWPVMTALMVGPRKSGRTLLARIFAAKTGGRFIDDAERQPEAQLFHAWNAAQEERRPQLFVADVAPPEWAVRLPDLRSRLAASPLIRLGPPDEPLMAALFERQFLRRGIDARADLVQWLVARTERSHIAVLRVVDLLEQAALQSRRRLSIPLARATLLAAGAIARPHDSSEAA